MFGISQIRSTGQGSLREMKNILPGSVNSIFASVEAWRTLPAAGNY